MSLDLFRTKLDLYRKNLTEEDKDKLIELLQNLIKTED